MALVAHHCFRLRTVAVCFLLFFVIDARIVRATDGIEAGITAWNTALTFATTDWTCSAANRTISCSPSGITYVCDWSVGAHTGVCYDWGGYVSVEDFGTLIGQGYGAGCQPALAPGGDLACTTGVDCAGLVSQVWGLGTRIGTRDLDDYSDQGDAVSSAIHTGYAALKEAHHVALLYEYSGTGSYLITEATTGGYDKVVTRNVDPSYLSGYALVRNSAWIYPDSPLEYCTTSGGTVNWSVSDETGIVDYVVMQAHNLNGPWTTVGGPVSSGASPYSLSGVTSRYAMVCADDGAKLHELGVAQPAAALKHAPTPAHVESSGRDTKTSWTSPIVNGRVGIIAPASWSATVTALKTYWETQGCDVLVSLLPDDWPYFQDVRSAPSGRAEVKATIDSWWSSEGVRYVMLVGDSVYTTDGAEGYCDQAIIPGYFGRTDLDECTNPDFCVQWVYGKDMPYADVSGDGIPDMVLTRLPVSSEAEFANYFGKMVRYNLGAINAKQYDVMSIAVDVAGPRMRDAGEYVAHIADGMVAGPFAGAVVREIRESTVLEESEISIQQKICDTWSTFWPELVVINSYRSNQNNVGEVLHNDQWPYIAPEHNAVVLAPICYGGLFDRGRTSQKAPLEYGLVAQPDGPIAVIGPCAGTWEVANNQFERFFVEELFNQPARPMAESYRLAVQRMYAEFPDQPKMLRTIERYYFLGDPISPFRNRLYDPVSGVSDGDSAHARLTCNVSPNPFNPRVTIALDNPQRQQVEIKAYDVRGMLVKSIYSGAIEVGHTSLNWDGSDDRGHSLAGGVYLVMVRAGSEKTVQRVTLVR